MTILPKISIAAAVALLGAPFGMSADAQQPTGACYQTCRIQYNWPASQCASYCRARSTGQSSMFAPARPGRVYGYTSGGGGVRGPGSCGTYMYWTPTGCADARNK
jgi:hypothetical protein